MPAVALCGDGASPALMPSVGGFDPPGAVGPPATRSTQGAIPRRALLEFVAIRWRNDRRKRPRTLPA
jgi:hypothetical protein